MTQESIVSSIKALDEQIKCADQKNLEQREALDLALAANKESLKALSVLNEVTEKTQTERKKLDDILVKTENVTKQHEELISKCQVLRGQQLESEQIVEQLTDKITTRTEALDQIEAEIRQKSEELVVLRREHETAVYNRDTLANEVKGLKEEKERMKMNISIFVERSEKLGINSREGLKLICEADEEVVSQIRISDPSKQYYIISKKL